MERNDKHKLDRILREQLNARPQPPDAELWRDIERQLDKRSRRGFFFRKRYLLILLLVAGLGGSYSLYRFNAASDSVVSTSNQNFRSSTAVEQPAAPLDERESTNTAAAKSDYASARIDNPIENQSNEAVPPTHVQHNTGNTQLDLTHKQHISAAPTQLHEKSITTSDNNLAVALDEEINQGSGIASPEPTSANVNDEATTRSAIDNNSNQPSASNETLANENQPNETQPTFENTVTLAVVDNAALPTLTLQDISADSLTSTDALQSEPEEAAFAFADALAPKRWQIFIGAQTQLYHVSKTIADDGAWPLDYTERRKREEKSTLAWSHGLRFGVEHKRFVLQSGIALCSFSERIEYSNRSRRYLVRSTMHYTADTAMLAFDTTAVSEVNSKLDVQNGVHQNRFVEIPLMLGYRFGNNNVSLTPSAGVSFAKPVQWSSRYINRLGNDLENPETVYGLNPLVKSFVAELSFGTALSQRLYLDASGACRLQMQSMFKTNGPNQRYQTFGGGVGLRYAF